jgi:hypothetical protein
MLLGMPRGGGIRLFAFPMAGPGLRVCPDVFPS